MKNLIIIGASGFGREMAQYIEDINESRPLPEWNLLGFIDDNPHALDGIEHGLMIIDGIAEHQPRNDVFYACAIAFPSVKRKIVTMLKERGARFATIIHPTARVSRYAHLGEGVVVTPGSNINIDASVGDFVSVLASGIGHDASVGDFSTLSGHVWINGHVCVGNNVYMGCGSMVAPSKKIGDNATVGIGSVVVSNIRAGIKVFGNPAKKIDF